MSSILSVLMKRDGMSEAQALEMINDAKVDLMERLDRGEMPDDICEEWFGLEPDYIDELLPL